MKKRKAAKRPRRKERADPAPVAALFCLVLAIFLVTSMVTFSSGDWPNPHVFPHADPIHNACGKVGAWVSYHSVRLVGAGFYTVLAFGLAGCFLWLVRGPLDHLLQRVTSLIVLAVVTSSAADVLWSGPVFNLPNGYGGALGQMFGTLMRENFHGFGTFLILTYCALAALLFIIDGLWNAMTRLASGIGRTVRTMLSAATSAGAAVATAASRMIKYRPSLAGGAAGSAVSGSFASKLTPLTTSKRSTKPTAVLDAEDDLETDCDFDDDFEESEVKTGRPATHQSIQPTFRSNEPSPNSTTSCYPAVLDDWVLPPVSLLDELEQSFVAEQETAAREMAKILEDALGDFKVEARVVEIETGPVITMFQLQLAAGVKVSQIMALSNDLARALRAPAIRVVATIAGKNTVGIEVPRLDREKVRLKELMTLSGKQAQEMALPLFLGKDASGNPMTYDLSQMPHLLIAGTTGSGKSVCINSIIMSLLMTQRPDRVKLILIDPKMVELSCFKDVPHLMSPIVTDVHKAAKILEWACTKMDERYSQLAEAGVRNIKGYNRLSEEELYQRFHAETEQEKEQVAVRLPYVVIVIDELADLMMTSGKEVEFNLARLAQKSRAVGIHIVVATQRPEAKVVTGLIKSNMPCRCAFRVAARMDSRIVLDQNGAEVLLGQGDMLFLPPGSAVLMRSQGTFIEDSEVRNTVSDLKSKGRCDYHPELVKIRSESDDAGGQRDELFNQAVDMVLQSKRGSVSLLQRRLTIGYSRASRLIDQMAGAGIVGEYKGSQAREVLLTTDEWQVLKAQVQDDLAAGYEADEDQDLEIEEEHEDENG